MSGPPGSDPGGPRTQEVPKGIATAITEVSERASALVHEEIELAKAEISEKATRLVKGAIVGVAAGVFIVTALFFVLVGLAWLLYYYLPIGSTYTYFWGFFAMALILLVLGLIAGLIAAKAVKRGAPPTPDMAIEEARLIRDTVSSSTPESTVPPAATPAAAAASPAAGPAPYGAAAPAAGAPAATPPPGGPGQGDS